MDKNKKKLLFEHAQRYIRAVMAEQLRKEGFVSKDGDDIHWYRVVDKDVVHSIYFITRHAQLPMFLKIGYGCHPLFITPAFPSGPYMYDLPAFEVLYPRYILMKEKNRYCFAEDAMVSCPADDFYGLDILENIFPLLEHTQTPLSCYQKHLEWRKESIDSGNWLHLSTQFMDEVVYWEDKDLYPLCSQYILGRTTWLEEAQQKAKLRKADKVQLDNLKLLKTAIVDGNRDSYLKVLEEREKQTISLIKKHTGLSI